MAAGGKLIPPTRMAAPPDHAWSGDPSVMKARIDQVDRGRGDVAARSNGVLVGEDVAVIGGSGCMPGVGSLGWL